MIELLIVLLVSGWIAYFFTYVVPGYTYDVPELFGRVLETRKSGIHWRLAGFMKHRFQSTKDFQLSDVIKYIASDGVEVTIPVNMLVAADADIKIPHGDLMGTNRFVQVKKEDLKPGLRDMIAVEVATTGARNLSEAARANLPALTAIANCKVRLKEMPHKDHDPATCRLPGCTTPPGTVDWDNMMAFYTSHLEPIRKILASERADDEHSDAENAFGVDVALITLNEPSFSGEVVAAGEAKKKAESRLAAAGAVKDLAAELVDPEGKFKLDRREAIHVSMHLVHGTPLSISSFEGLGDGGAFNAAAAKLAAGDTGSKGGK